MIRTRPQTGHFCMVALLPIPGQVEGALTHNCPRSERGRCDESWAGEEVGGTNLDYLHFPELGGSQSGLAWGSPAACASRAFPPPPTPNHLPKPRKLDWGWEGEEGMAALQPSKEPLPLFLRLRGKADLLWGWVILLAR